MTDMSIDWVYNYPLMINIYIYTYIIFVITIYLIIVQRAEYTCTFIYYSLQVSVS